VAQLATLHSPGELQLAVIAPEVPEASVGWLRWLPHTVTTNGAPLLAWDDASADELVGALNNLLQQRADAGPPTAARESPRGRLVVVLLGTGDLRRRPQLAALLARGPSLGVTKIGCLTDRVLIFGERHLRTTLARYSAHHNGRRPHRAQRLRPPHPDHPAPDLDRQRIKRRPVLGGLISEYERAA
jgi:DNA segregation ATPase FtsK/SpoIIIE-like protein